MLGLKPKGLKNCYGFRGSSPMDKKLLWLLWLKPNMLKFVVAYATEGQWTKILI